MLQPFNGQSISYTLNVLLFLLSKSKNYFNVLGFYAVLEGHYKSKFNYKKNIWRNPVYCSLSTKNPPPLIFDIFICLFQVMLGKGQVCPAVLGKRFSQGPAGLDPPAGARIRKKRKIKIRGEGLFVLQEHNTEEYRNFCYKVLTLLK